MSVSLVSSHCDYATVEVVLVALIKISSPKLAFLQADLLVSVTKNKKKQKTNK